MINYEASKQSVNMELYYTDDIEVFFGERVQSGKKRIKENLYLIEFWHPQRN